MHELVSFVLVVFFTIDVPEDEGLQTDFGQYPISDLKQSRSFESESDLIFPYMVHEITIKFLV